MVEEPDRVEFCPEKSRRARLGVRVRGRSNTSDECEPFQHPRRPKIESQG